MKKTVHVHVNSPRAKTRDGEGEGHWVTINGAHVMIGEGGKITKGPAALVGKSENQAHESHHEAKYKEHLDAAEAKGPAHKDHAAHSLAAANHAKAAGAYAEADYHANEGNIKAARQYRADADKHAALAEQHAAKTLPAPPETPSKEKPLKHAAMHNEAADDVKGSEKHEAEHKRLLGLYDGSKAKWEHDAVNRLIQKNAIDAVQTKAQNAHHTALAASEHAKKTGAGEDHQNAIKHIDAAIAAHGIAGGVGWSVKQTELQKTRKEHDKAVNKAYGPVIKSHTDAAKKARQDADYHAGLGDEKSSALLGELAKHHDYVAANPADDHTARFKQINNMRDAIQEQQISHAAAAGGGASPGKGNAYIKDPNKPLPKRAGTTSQQQDFKKAHAASKSALDKIAERAAKKGAEEAADQDPKHKA